MYCVCLGFFGQHTHLANKKRLQVLDCGCKNTTRWDDIQFESTNTFDYFSHVLISIGVYQLSKRKKSHVFINWTTFYQMKLESKKNCLLLEKRPKTQQCSVSECCGCRQIKSGQRIYLQFDLKFPFSRFTQMQMKNSKESWIEFSLVGSHINFVALLSLFFNLLRSFFLLFLFFCLFSVSLAQRSEKCWTHESRIFAYVELFVS